MLVNVYVVFSVERAVKETVLLSKVDIATEHYA